MNLAQASVKLSDERMKQFARSAVWVEASAQEMSWREAMLDRRAVNAASNRLSSLAKASLVSLILRFGAAPVEEERLLAELREHTTLSGAEARMGLSQLQEAGIVLFAAKMWGDRSCFIPLDSFMIWQQSLFPCPWAGSAAPVQPLMDGSGGFLGVKEPFGRRVLYMLAALMKSETAFTSKGVLSKKTLQRLQAALELEEGPLKALSWRVARGESYPVPVAVGLAAAAALGLQRREEKGINVDQERLQSWCAMSDCEREQGLFHWICGYLLRGSREDAHIGSALANAPSGEWLSASEVAEWGTLLIERSGIVDVNGSMRNQVERWLFLMQELGWMELAERQHPSKGAELMFRRRGFSSVLEGQLILQPTGELLAAPGSSFGMRWELELIAERIHREEPVLYRLTAASVAAALEQGRTKEGISRFLREASREQELPVQLRSMLDQWASRACRYTFEQATLLRCDTAELAEEAMKLSGSAPDLLVRISEKDFIIHPSAVGEIRLLLNKAGYPPRKKIIESFEDKCAVYPALNVLSAELQSYPEFAADRYFESGEWLYESMSLRHHELEQAMEAKAVKLLSGLDQVPAAWWRQLRSYHASTRKELMQQAVAMETAVQLKLEGQLRHFIPEQIDLRGEQWSVTGKLVDDDQSERSRLTPDMWEEMKLMLPSGVIL
ncbi:helicase-associated domain-containing protein [Paenibacillus sp. NPDC057967]|uniref:helicase-associated domain-containing protein n=1 Tax=Paenibacillus sp. NPDC057967 TaxID=3346293 RepID=UPI0036DA5E98